MWVFGSVDAVRQTTDRDHPGRFHTADHIPPPANKDRTGQAPPPPSPKPPPKPCHCVTPKPDPPAPAAAAPRCGPPGAAAPRPPPFAAPGPPWHRGSRARAVWDGVGWDDCGWGGKGVWGVACVHEGTAGQRIYPCHVDRPRHHCIAASLIQNAPGHTRGRSAVAIAARRREAGEIPFPHYSTHTPYASPFMKYAP